jgi:hypothetical protein
MLLAAVSAVSAVSAVRDAPAPLRTRPPTKAGPAPLTGPPAR